MHNLTPLSGLIGGALIGLAAAMLMLLPGASPVSAASLAGFFHPRRTIAAGGSPSLRG